MGPLETTKEKLNNNTTHFFFTATKQMFLIVIFVAFDVCSHSYFKWFHVILFVLLYCFLYAVAFQHRMCKSTHIFASFRLFRCFCCCCCSFRFLRCSYSLFVFFSVRSSTVSYCLLCLHGQVASKCSQARSSSCSHFPFQFSFTFSFSVDAVWCLYVFAFGEVSSFRSYYVPCFRHFLSVFFFSRINAVFACLITVFYLLPVWYKWSHINFNDMNCGFFLALWIQMHLHHSSNSFLYGSFVGFFFVPFSPSTCAQMIKRFTIAHCDALCFLGARIIIIYGRPNEQKKTPPFFFSLAILLREW